MSETLRQLLSAERVVNEFDLSVPLSADILAEPITPESPPEALSIYVVPQASAVLSVARTRGGSTNTEDFNGGSALTADAIHIGNIIIEEGDSVNFRYGSADTFKAFFVGRLAAPFGGSAGGGGGLV